MEDTVGNTVEKTPENGENTAKPEKKKSKLMRRILRVIAWIFAVILLLLAILIVFRDTIIKNSITGVGSWLTGVEIKLEDFETSLAEGDVKITNLKIANPKGYDKSHLVALGSFYLNIDLPSLLTNNIVIEEIDVNGLQLTAEFNRNGKFNAVEIVENIQNKVPAPAGDDGTAGDNEAVAENTPDDNNDAAPAPQKNISIEIIDVSNSNATIYDDRVGIPVSVPLVYSNTDLQLAESGEDLLAQLHDLALQLQNACSGVANAGELVMDTGKQLIDSTTDAGKQLTDSGKKLIDSTTDAGKQLTESGKKLLDVFKF